MELNIWNGDLDEDESKKMLNWDLKSWDDITNLQTEDPSRDLLKVPAFVIPQPAEGGWSTSPSTQGWYWVQVVMKKK